MAPWEDGPSGSAAEERLRSVPWEALCGLCSALEAPLREILAGAPAERVLRRLLRSLPGLGAPGRWAVAEGVLGVALWRRRLLAQLSLPQASPGLLLAALFRDLGGRKAAGELAGLPRGALPPPRPPPSEFADRWSFPDWLAGELRRAAGADASALADALNRPGPVSFRPNLLKTTPGALAARLASEGVLTVRGRLVPTCLIAPGRPNVYGLAAHREGLFEVQDEGSQLVGALVEARPGEAILDACAGAGGKALLLAGAVGPKGRVHAADPDPERLGRLRARAERAGALGIVVLHGAAAPVGLLVDRALVDAPCSELGALRRGPDLRWRMDARAFAPLPGLQRGILAGAARHVRIGGRLVYATCTLRPEENESVVLDFEASHAGFRRIRPEVAGAARCEDGFLRTFPHRHGTDAFFAAAWERRA